MLEPKKHFVQCPGAAAQSEGEATTHRMAYWEWNRTGNPVHPHVIVCVHGLTRQGRDFDVLAHALSAQARVICPDVVGRGGSDWLADPTAYGVPQYAQDMVVLLQHLHQQAPIDTLDWLGTSMGGLIGMAIAGNRAWPLPVPVRKLLLNDIGPVMQWPALQRIAAYVGQSVRFDSVSAGAQALRALSAGFGPHTDAQWLALSEPMLKPTGDGDWQLHYDPAIAVPMQGMTQAQSVHAQAALWALYDGITAQTLLVRGAQSDLIAASTAQDMQARGPRARTIELENVGHAPTFVARDQVVLAQNFFFG